jgi:ribosome-associated protein
VTIIQDTRERANQHNHVLSGFQKLGINVVRSKLLVGDYTRIDNMTVCVDTKKNLQEVYCNVIQDHRRFTDECKAAFSAGIKLTVLVEESGINSVHDVANWKNPRMLRWERLRDAHKAGKRMKEQLSPYPPVSSERLCKAMQTIAERYHIEWRFCDKADTARTICDILGIEVDNP